MQQPVYVQPAVVMPTYQPQTYYAPSYYSPSHPPVGVSLPERSEARRCNNDGPVRECV